MQQYSNILQTNLNQNKKKMRGIEKLIEEKCGMITEMTTVIKKMKKFISLRKGLLQNYEKKL